MIFFPYIRCHVIVFSSYNIQNSSHFDDYKRDYIRLYIDTIMHIVGLEDPTRTIVVWDYPDTNLSFYNIYPFHLIQSSSPGNGKYDQVEHWFPQNPKESILLLSCMIFNYLFSTSTPTSRTRSTAIPTITIMLMTLGIQIFTQCRGLPLSLVSRFVCR